MKTRGRPRSTGETKKKRKKRMERMKILARVYLLDLIWLDWEKRKKKKEKGKRRKTRNQIIAFTKFEACPWFYFIFGEGAPRWTGTCGNGKCAQYNWRKEKLKTSEMLAPDPAKFAICVILVFSQPDLSFCSHHIKNLSLYISKIRESTLSPLFINVKLVQTSHNKYRGTVIGQR